MARLAVARLAALGVCLLVASSPSMGQRGDDKLNLLQAREYMVTVINVDRAIKGLPEVKLDDAATVAAQRHAEEMAANRYLAHMNLAGKLADQRYTEAGGQHAVMENVYFRGSVRAAHASPLPVLKAPRFSESDIEDIEAAYFNEVPPHDGHRRNILGANHTHVGIGLAQAADGSSWTLANCQLFVDKAVEPYPIAMQYRAGAEISVSFDAGKGIEAHGATLARQDMPKPRTRSELGKMAGYKIPAGKFRGEFRRGFYHNTLGPWESTVQLAWSDEPGLYTLTIWVRRKGGEPFAASRRTFVLEADTTSPKPSDAQGRAVLPQ